MKTVIGNRTNCVDCGSIFFSKGISDNICVDCKELMDARTVRKLNKVIKSKRCLGCDKIIATDRCHRFCKACKQRNDDLGYGRFPCLNEEDGDRRKGEDQ